MGLQLTKTTSAGFTVKDAYARIDTISGNKNYIYFSLNTYVSREAFMAGKSFVSQEYYSFQPSVGAWSENFIRQAYFYLKATPEYKDAIDVIEIP